MIAFSGSAGGSAVLRQQYRASESRDVDWSTAPQ